MRISRLDLLRYGRFSDLSLSFPAKTPDLHIVFGPNEAGKSTTLSAIENLLFGIPSNSTLNFLHDHAALRIGALLEKEGERLEVRRRKGNKETLLTREDLPMVTGESVLAPYLAGADLTFFTRMFSLDSSRLRQGGNEILEAKEEVGQMLFSAASGLSGLRDSLASLEEEADGLWGTRRSTKRIYYQADDRREEAEKILRTHLVTPTKWLEAKNIFDAARNAYNALEKEIEKTTSDKKRLDRIRRSYRNVRQLEEVNRDLLTLQDVPDLHDGARDSLQAAERAEEKSLGEVRILTEQIESSRKELSALEFDTTLVRHEEDIQKLHEGRIRIRDEKASLPKREAELATTEANFSLLASELGWNGQDVGNVIERLPPRVKTTEVRRLLTDRGAVISAVDAARQTFGEAEDKVADLSILLNSLGTPAGLSTLDAVTNTVRSLGDISALIRSAAAEVDMVQSEIERLVCSITPPPDSEILPGQNLPSRESVQTHRDSVRDLDRKLQTIREKIRSCRQDLDRNRKTYERLIREGKGVAPEALDLTRKRRNAVWSLIRRKFVENAAVPPTEIRELLQEGEDLVVVYETTVEKADALADLQVEKADATAKLAILSGQIREQEEILNDLENEKAALDQETQSLEGEWKRMWAGLSSGPLEPDLMLDWLEARKEWGHATEQKFKIERRREVISRQEEESKLSLLEALATSGIDVSDLSGMPLAVVLERAEEILSRN
ncbi:MAG: AAA family ATPase, partial [Leptospirales bacterium]